MLPEGITNGSYTIHRKPKMSIKAPKNDEKLFLAVVFFLITNELNEIFGSNEYQEGYTKKTRQEVF